MNVPEPRRRGKKSVNPEHGVCRVLRVNSKIASEFKPQEQ
jgi:hypothetical protein